MTLSMIAGLVTLMAYFPYSWAVLRKVAVPKLSTWIVFLVMDILNLWSSIQLPNGPSLWVPASYTAGTTIILGLAIWKSKDRSFSLLEKACLFFSAVGLLILLITGNGMLGLILGLTILVVGVIPTYIQAWKEPEKEDLIAWSIFGLSATLNLLAPENQETVSQWMYSVVVLLVDVPIALMVARPFLSKILQPKT